jgi:hypothetical protein
MKRYLLKEPRRVAGWLLGMVGREERRRDWAVITAKASVRCGAREALGIVCVLPTGPGLLCSGIYGSPCRVFGCSQGDDLWGLFLRGRGRH